MPQIIKTISIITVFCIAVFMLTKNIDTSISRGDESIHTRVVQEMTFENGSFLKPVFFNDLYLNKPPLQFWLSTPIVKLFGDENENYRIVPIIAGIGTCIVLLLFSIAFFGSIFPGLFCILLALGGKQVIFDHGMRVATMDSLLLFLTTSALFSIWKALQTEKKTWILATGLLIGLACFTKWVAGLLPWMVLGVLFVTDAQTRKTVLKTFPYWLYSALLSFSIPGLFIAYHLLTNYQVTIDSLRLNISERLIGKGFHNQEEIFLYVKAILHNLYGNIWIIAIGFCGSLFFIKQQKIKFLVIWALLPLLLYSSLNSRLPWYYLPAVPALWLLAAHFLHSLSFTKVSIQYALIFLALIPIYFSLNQNVQRVLQSKKIRMDKAVDILRANTDREILFVGVSPKIQTSLNMSRRYLLYLNRLGLSLKKVSYADTFDNIKPDIAVVPYIRLEDIPKADYKSYFCPESDFKKPYDVACFFSTEMEPGFRSVSKSR